MNIDDLRDEVQRRRSAATAKIRRQRSKGVNLEGTKIDPRREVGVEKNYTKRQLESYLRELNSFTSRSTRIVPIAGGKFVTGDQWRRYKEAERRYNRRVNRAYGKVANLKIPNTGMTVAERDMTMGVNDRRVKAMRGTASRRLYEPSRLRPSQVASPEALEKLIRDMRKKTSSKWHETALKNQRKEMLAMAKTIGNKKLIKEAKSLTNEQFDTLWNYTPFASDLSRGYERKRLLDTGGAGAEQDRVQEDTAAEAIEAITWAKALPSKGRRSKA